MEKSVQLISNFNIDPLIRSLQRMNNPYDFCEPIEYNHWLNFLEDLNSSTTDNLFVFIDGTTQFGNQEFEAIFNLIDYYFDVIERYVAFNSKCILFINSIDINPDINTINENFKLFKITSYWNEKISLLINKYKNIRIYDYYQLILDHGRTNLYSQKSFFLQSYPFSLYGERLVSHLILSSLDAIYTVSKKLLVIDLDNTIWGGVLSELGVLGLEYASGPIGRVFTEVQRKIKRINNNGVILGIASKNNKEEVIEALNSKRFYLEYNDFVSIKANWNKKYLNIIEMANEINISLDSIVFIDDNELEREEVRIHVPEITVIDFPVNIEDLPLTIDNMFNVYFRRFNLTNEDRIRSESYLLEATRNNEKSKYKSIEDYIISLNIIPILSIAQDQQFTRVSQLTERTNQFNLTNKKYSENQLFDYKKDGNLIYIGKVSDKFGSYGEVFVAMISKKKDKLHIDNLLMSCRVMGKRIEYSFMKLIERLTIEMGYRTIESELKLTSKNQPVENFFEILGYETIQTKKNGNKKYKKLLDDSEINVLYEAKYE